MVDSRENENTQKLFSHEEVVFSFYGWTIPLFLLGEILLTIPKKNACFHYNSLITNGLIFIQIRHSLIGEFTLFLHLHHHFFAQAVRNLYFRQGLTPFLLGSDTFPSRSDTFSRALLLLAVYSVTFSTSSVTFPSYLVTISQSLVTFSQSLVTFSRTQIKKRVSHFVAPHSITRA